MKAVFKLHFDCGRSGELTGLFIAEKEQVEWLKQSKLEVYFGEVLGKHSEVFGPLDESDITLVSEDESVVKVIEDNDLENGFNPFHYSLMGTEDLLGDKHEDDLTPSEVYTKLHS